MRPRTRLFLAVLFMATIAGGAATFLYIQLGPSCKEHLPRVQKTFTCKCSGIEFTRVNRASTGHINTVCLGRASDYLTNFSFWTEGGLARSDRVKVEVGIQTLLDSTEVRFIRAYAQIFERFTQGWQRVKGTVVPAQQRITFTVYTPAAGGLAPVKNDIWFGVGEDFLEVQGGYRRALTPKEKALIQNLMG